MNARKVCFHPQLAFCVAWPLLGVIGIAVTPPRNAAAEDKPLAQVVEEMSAAKADIMKRHMALLEQRYDLSDQPAKGATMSRNKPLQGGVRVRLPRGTTWEQLATMKP